jgi:hypothetical protein
LGIFSTALMMASGQISANPEDGRTRQGFVGWLLGRVRQRSEVRRRLVLVERISLAPRQTVCLLEVDDQKLLIATAQDSSPSLCLLSSNLGQTGGRLRHHVPFEGFIE